MHPHGRKLIAFALGLAALGAGACKKDAPPPPAQEEASVPPPVPATPETLIAGAHIYHQQCAFCHGLKGQPKTAAGKGEFPQPPQLFEHIGVTDDPVGETYWKTANGIRLTGMPSYRPTLSEEQMWQVSQLLATTVDKLPAEAQRIVSTP